MAERDQERGDSIPEFDVMRGTAIVFVVFMHAWFSPWSATPRHEVLAMHVLHLFGHSAVPVFFFIAAFLQARDDTPGIGEYLSKRVRRVLGPLLFWMLAALAYRAWDGGGLDRAMVKDFLLFNISGQYYYLFVLIVFMVAFFFARGWSSRRLGMLAAAAFVVNLATVAWYEQNPPGGDAGILAYRNPGMWVFAYAAGLWAGRRPGSLDQASRLLAPALAGMGATMAAYLAAGEGLGHYPASYFGVTVFLFSVCALAAYPGLVRLVARSAEGRRLESPLAALSPYAFGIYLVHMPFFVGYVTDRLVSPNPSLAGDWLTLVAALFVCGFATTAAFVIGAAWVAPRFARDLLGVRLERARHTREPRLEAARRRGEEGART
jgi:peptidoglycan/LPS O-acetylase OafA/YrhL